MRHHTRHRFCAQALLWAALLAPRPAPADSIAINPSADTTLIQVAPDRNNGAEAWVNAGTTQNFTRNRGLFKFDIAGLIPAQSVINSVTLVLEVTRQPRDGFNPSSYGLYRMLSSWGEGDKFAIDNNGGMGAPASTDNTEATWTHRFFPDIPWAAPGGAPGIDFSTTVSQEQFIFGVGQSPYTFPSSPEMVEDAQLWLDHPESNFGWMLLSQAESTDFTARRFGSKDGDFPPYLFVDYTVVPEPGTVALGMLALAVVFIARRRRSAASR